MFLHSFDINEKSLVADVVSQDYRTAEVFRKYGIGYCCGGKWPIEMACQMNGVDPVILQQELEMATRTNSISNSLDFTDCTTDFIIDFIVNIHHNYLKKSLGVSHSLLQEFSKEHLKKYAYLSELLSQFELLVKILINSMQQEEEVIFPYIRHLAHAHKDKEPYAALLVKTLRKPLEVRMFRGQDTITEIILLIRSLTGNYSPPEKACVSHKVVFAKLKELDNEIIQHAFLEHSVLFPRAIEIEKEVLNS